MGAFNEQMIREMEDELDALQVERAQLRADLAEAGLHARVCLDACNKAEAERDQLHADKDELLAWMMRWRCSTDDCRMQMCRESRALIAKHEAKS